MGGCCPGAGPDGGCCPGAGGLHTRLCPLKQGPFRQESRRTTCCLLRGGLEEESLPAVSDSSEVFKLLQKIWIRIIFLPFSVSLNLCLVYGSVSASFLSVSLPPSLPPSIFLSLSLHLYLSVPFSLSIPLSFSVVSECLDISTQLL